MLRSLVSVKSSPHRSHVDRSVQSTCLSSPTHRYSSVSSPIATYTVPRSSSITLRSFSTNFNPQEDNNSDDNNNNNNNGRAVFINQKKSKKLVKQLQHAEKMKKKYEKWEEVEFEYSMSVKGNSRFNSIYKNRNNFSSSYRTTRVSFSFGWKNLLYN